MKTLFKISYAFLAFAWLPIFFLSTAHNLLPQVKVIIFGISLILYIIGAIGFLGTVMDNPFWKSQSDFEKAKERAIESKRLYEEAKEKLIQHVLKIKADEPVDNDHK